MSQPQDPAELFAFSQLEEALQGENAGQHLMEELKWVTEQRQQIVAKLKDGLDQESHHQTIRLAHAFDAASNILKAPPIRKDK